MRELRLLRSVHRSLLLAIVALCLPLSVHAATIHVPAGSPTIQAAINSASGGDTIIVAPGTYHEAINFNGKAITLISSGGPSQTTIDATGLNTSVVTCNSGENDDTIFEGFTVTGGKGTLFGPDRLGGGMYVMGTSPTIRNCVFEGNNADAGGGMMNFSGSPLIANSVFRNNHANFGAITVGGGGLMNNGGIPKIINSIFEGNTAENWGGGMNNLGASPLIINTMFLDNDAPGGGGIRNALSAATIINCSFAGNTSMQGPAIRNSSNGSTVAINVVNSAIWGNGANPILDLAGAETHLTFSVIEGGWAGIGVNNISQSPQFVDAANGDLQLSEGSPAIDAGFTSAYDAIDEAPAEDLDGSPRKQQTIDIGAYEYQPGDDEEEGEEEEEEEEEEEQQPPKIVFQPESLTVVEGQTAEFSVSATGYGTLSYQWQREGANISGETSASLSVSGVQLDDNGTRFRVKVTNAQGTTTSSNALLTVVPTESGVILVQASDGSSERHIHVSWSEVSSISLLELFRSEYSGDLGVVVFYDSTKNSFTDRSVIPGVKYYYRLRIVHSDGEVVITPPNSGFRISQDEQADTDGDGVSDAREELDGSDPADRGSFKPNLESPAATKYNTFLEQYNFLELTATGSRQVEATISVYSIEGSLIATQAVSIAPRAEVDVDIHSLVDMPDTFGVVQIEFNDDEASLSGRITNYRLNDDGLSYSFAFAKELRNGTRGPTYASANSMSADGSGSLVANWAEIINLDSSAQTFSYNIYDQSGALVSSEEFTVQPNSEYDTSAGHEQGAGVYLVEILPHDGAARYLASISRYSSSPRPGELFNYALPFAARAGNGDAQYLFIANEVGPCWAQSNWVEIASVREKAVDVSVTFRGQAGELIEQMSISIEARAQVHLNAGALLSTGSQGAVTISSFDPGSLLSQSLFYFHDCVDNGLQSAYVSPSQIAGRSTQLGTFNTFLGMGNVLSTVVVGASELELTLELLTAEGVVAEQLHSMSPQHLLQLGLSDEAMITGINNNYGVLSLEPSGQGAEIVSQNLRIRELAGRVDFAISTPVR